jgi:hypothetical protein
VIRQSLISKKVSSCGKPAKPDHALDRYFKPLYESPMRKRNAVLESRARVQTFIRSGYATKSELARKANIPATTCMAIDTLDWNPTVETLSALLDAVDDMEADYKARPRFRRGSYQPAA